MAVCDLKEVEVVWLGNEEVKVFCGKKSCNSGESMFMLCCQAGTGVLEVAHC